MSKEVKKTVFEKIKEAQEKKGAGGGNKFYTKDGENAKVRFLTDLDEALILKFHSSKFDKSGKANRDDQIFHPCLAYYGKKCPSCSNKELIDVDIYIWQVYSYDQKAKQFTAYKANKCTPVFGLAKKHELKGTLLDRDYIISQMGEGTDVKFDIDSGDQKVFKKEIELWTQQEILDLIKEESFLFKLGKKDKEDDDDEDEEEVKPKKKKAVVVDDEDEEEVKPKKKKVIVEDDEDEVPVKKKKKKVVVEEDEGYEDD